MYFSMFSVISKFEYLIFILSFVFSHKREYYWIVWDNETDLIIFKTVEIYGDIYELQTVIIFYRF